MPIEPLFRNPRGKSSKIEKAVERHRSPFEQAGIRNFIELRRTIAARGLKALGVADDEAKAFDSFGALARIFPIEVALVLSEQGAAKVATVARWPEKKFIEVLEADGIAQAEIAKQRTRFARLRELVKKGHQARGINGLQVDLGRDYAALKQYHSALAAKGVETLADWAYLRDEMALAADERRLLDSYARLSVLGLKPATVKRLIEQGIDSLIALSRQTKAGLKKLAKSTGIDFIALSSAQQLGATLASQVPIGDDSQFEGLWERQCVTCADEEAVFSKFGYFLYLVAQTGSTLAELEDTLFQEFSRLTPADDHETVSQVSLCNQVLQAALGRNLNASEQLPEENYRVISILRQAVALGPQQLIGYLSPGGIPTAALTAQLPNLITAYNAPPPRTEAAMLHPRPIFSPDILEALLFIGEAFLLDEITAEPAFAGATPRQLEDEIGRRERERAKAELDFCQLIRRAALKRALNKTDRQLFAQLFIETDLPLCEQTTSLDQAIRTLQSYLDKQGMATPPYLSFGSWRGEMMGQTYLETTILLRDDVLLGDTGTFDRGSILRNHLVQHAEIKAQLSKVRSAIDGARVDTNIETISNSDWEALGKFKDEPAYNYFQRGLKVIDNILEANNKMYLAAGDIDSEEPGIALGKLQEAVDLLDRVDEELFDNHWFWANQESSSKQYAKLLVVSSAERVSILSEQFEYFVNSPKKLFQLQQPDVRVGGLTDDTVLEVGHPEWVASVKFKQGSNYIYRDEAEEDDTFSQFYYDEGWGLTDYTFSCEFRADSYWGDQENGSPKVGIVARLQDDGGGYRLAVLQAFRDDRVAEDVALQKVDTDGSATNLEKAESGYGGRTDIEASTIKTGEWYGLTITVSGAQISGALKKGGRTIYLGPVQDASFDKGSISLIVQGTAEVDFRNIAFRAEAPTGSPPFFAKRRADLAPELRSILDDFECWQHVGGQPVSVDLIDEPVIVPSDKYDKQRLYRIKREGDDLYLTLPPGGSKVILNRLDRLLERSLMLTYYLRFAAIPLRMAQAYLALGEYKNAASLLYILYDDEPDVPEFRPIYLFFDRSLWQRSEQGTDAAAMRIRLGEVYLRWAEMLFRRNTNESRYEARRLYERVLRLHGQEDCNCLDGQWQNVQRTLRLADEAHAPDGTIAAQTILRRDTYVRPGALDDAQSWREVQSVLRSERAQYQATLKREGVPAKLEAKALERIKSAELRLLGLSGTEPKLPQSNRLNVTPQPALAYSLTLRSLCTPGNPLVVAQGREACTMLKMLKSCVNILGYSDDLVPPLRFEALLRIAESFANLAQAAERDVLQFRQAFEQEAYTLMHAEADLKQANVTVAIEELNVELAAGEIALAETQRQQAQASVTHFEALVNEGMTATEEGSLAAADAAAGFAAVSAMFSIGALPTQIIPAVMAGNPASSIGAFGPVSGAVSNAFGAKATALAMRAGLERQQQDREFQLQQTRFGLSIAFQSVALARQRWTVAQLQTELASMRRDFARDALAFLNNKMLSAAGWLMLMKLAREQYRRRLTYAIEAAYLAERALAFELQNPAMSIIRFDYYDPRRDGLLGATQLITDLAQLAARKLAFHQRKLQLSKTISLATLFPAAFEQFRQGPGRFLFSTIAEIFDRDFPGHYMRLIQSVRVTVVALVPPLQGIRATLKNSGVSQVVVGPPYADVFESRPIRRNPEAIALSSGFQASGLFVLDYKDDLLLPFEGSGVVSDWEFELPKAANQFDFNTIADVLITLEYTALEGTAAYRNRVINRLGSEMRAERAFSFRTEFADKWYDLHHPELVDDAEQPMVVKFKTVREDFPPNLDQLSIEHIALYFAHDAAVAFTPVPVSYLSFANDGNRDQVSSDEQGIISTRRRRGLAGVAPASWRSPFTDESPVGAWELSFNFNDPLADEDIRRRFREGEIKDILLVISYVGHTTAW